MRKFKKLAALMMAVLSLVLLLAPTRTAHADWVGMETVKGSIIWQGDPTPVDMFVMVRNYLGVYVIVDKIWSKGQAEPISSAGLMPNQYLGNGKWKLSYEYRYTDQYFGGYPFIAINRATLDGKWYCDKWDWNNLVYQPGLYAEYEEPNGHIDNIVVANFNLTSSAPSDNSITVNRSWAGGAPAVDTTLNIYRYYDISKSYRLFQSTTFPKDQSSITFGGLYSGDYAVTQTLPSYYDDESTETYGGVPGTGKPVVLSSATAGSISFSNTYDPPVAYNVNIATLTDGTITPGKTTAFAGDTVNLTITPGADKQLKSGSLKYTDGTGDHLVSGTSFVMPDEAVTISAEFEAKQYAVSVASLSGGSVAADKTTAVSGETVTVTVTPIEGNQLKPGSLKYTHGSTTVPITGTSFEMPMADVSISAAFEVPASVSTTELPEGMKGNPYNATVAAQDGTPPYTWSADGLPDGLTISESGDISGTPTETGSFDVAFTATDGGGTVASKTLSLYISATCGNGGYLIKPVADAAFTPGMTAGGLPTMTINSGISGFRYFSVSIKAEKGHADNEVLLFVHMRGGQQIGINATLADFDTLTAGSAAFNVNPGDVIKVYIVDSLTNEEGVNPTIL